MNQEIQMLRQISRKTQKGQSSIRIALKRANEPALAKALTAQLREYDLIHMQAQKLLTSRGETVHSQSVLMQKAAVMGGSLHRKRFDSSSAIAEQVIRGSTAGMVMMLRRVRDCHSVDPKVSGLSNRLLQTELAGIEQMKPFL